MTFAIDNDLEMEESLSVFCCAEAPADDARIDEAWVNVLTHNILEGRHPDVSLPKTGRIE